MFHESLVVGEKRRTQIAYAEFVAAGYPIGSGMVESANKLVVQARLKGSGMHWARANVNPMLALLTVAVLVPGSLRAWSAAMQWNQEHGLGGPEVWAASAD